MVDASSVSHNNADYFHGESSSRRSQPGTYQDPRAPSHRLVPNSYAFFANSNSIVDPSLCHNISYNFHGESSSRSPIQPGTYQDPRMVSPSALLANSTSMSHNNPYYTHGESTCQEGHVGNPGFVENLSFLCKSDQYELQSWWFVQYASKLW